MRKIVKDAILVIVGVVIAVTIIVVPHLVFE